MHILLLYIDLLWTGITLQEQETNIQQIFMQTIVNSRFQGGNLSLQSALYIILAV